MKKIGQKGFKMSNADIKAFEHYLLETPEVWASKALKGLINKASKTILREWLPKHREKKAGSISADKAILIEEIVNDMDFKKYKREANEKRKPKRKQDATVEKWGGGFDVEDWEWTALEAYFDDPEQVLYDYMENKIALRKEAFVKEITQAFLKNPSVTEMPASDDDLIEMYVAMPGYKNRAQMEADNPLSTS